jgi:hypothetical protein
MTIDNLKNSRRPATASPADPTGKRAQSPAERTRAYRRRRRHGFRCVEVQIGRAELDGLVAKGYPPADKRQDLQAIQLAVNDLLFDWLQQT